MMSKVPSNTGIELKGWTLEDMYQAITRET